MTRLARPAECDLGGDRLFRFSGVLSCPRPGGIFGEGFGWGGGSALARSVSMPFSRSCALPVQTASPTRSRDTIFSTQMFEPCPAVAETVWPADFRHLPSPLRRSAVDVPPASLLLGATDDDAPDNHAATSSVLPVATRLNRAIW